MNLKFAVKAYKAGAGAWYGPSGQTVMVNCSHTIVGYYNMNKNGQFVAVDGASFAPTYSGSPVPAVLVPHATEFPNTPQPGLTLTSVVEIKDNVDQTAYYVDYVDYLAKVVACNPVAYATACPELTDLSHNTPTDTAVDILWTENPGIVGVEYVNSTSPVDPSSAGTFLPVGSGGITLTGLDTGTQYYFHVRTICAGGVTSAWQSESYSTSCALVTGLSAGTPGATTATITWTENPTILGIEYVNNTSAVAPVGSETFVSVGVGTVPLTGLTTATAYHFWIRTSCADGGFSAWTSLPYTTA